MWIPLRGMMNEPQHPEALEFQLWSGEQRERVDRETTTAVISREWRATGPPPRVLRSSVHDQSNRVPRRFAPLEKAGGEIFATNYKYI